MTAVPSNAPQAACADNPAGDEPQLANSADQLIADVVHDGGAWTGFGGDTTTLVAAAVAAVAGWPGLVEEPSEVAVALASDRQVAKLNSMFRGQEKPTNVLSFPAPPSIAGRFADGDDMDDRADDDGDPSGPSDDMGLSDDVENGPPRRQLGDIVLAEETLFREAADLAIPPSHHLQHLVVHGLLHLLGHDHEEPAAAERMETLETAILATIGVADPYLDSELE